MLIVGYTYIKYTIMLLNKILSWRIIMKKNILGIAIFSCMLSLSAFDFMNISGDVGIGYMNYTIVNNYDTGKLADNLSAELKALIGPGNLKLGSIKAKDSYNAFMVGLSFKMSYIYANINVGFPLKEISSGFDPLAQKLKEKGISDKINGSIIFDSQIGVGITLMKSSPLNIFVGGGLGINYIRTTRDLPGNCISSLSDVTSLKEIRSVGMIGLGADIGIKYFFMPKIGICLDLKDTIYFLPLANQRYYSGKLKNGIPFTYSINSETTTNSGDIKKLIKSTWANNFSVRLGVAFKL